MIYGKEEMIKMRKQEDGIKKAKSLRIAIYMRVGRIEQLGLEEQQKYFNLKM